MLSKIVLAGSESATPCGCKTNFCKRRRACLFGCMFSFIALLRCLLLLLIVGIFLLRDVPFFLQVRHIVAMKTCGQKWHSELDGKSKVCLNIDARQCEHMHGLYDPRTQSCDVSHEAMRCERYLRKNDYDPDDIPVVSVYNFETRTCIDEVKPACMGAATGSVWLWNATIDQCSHQSGLDSTQKPVVLLKTFVTSCDDGAGIMPGLKEICSNLDSQACNQMGVWKGMQKSCATFRKPPTPFYSFWHSCKSRNGTFHTKDQVCSNIDAIDCKNIGGQTTRGEECGYEPHDSHAGRLWWPFLLLFVTEVLVVLKVYVLRSAARHRVGMFGTDFGDLVKSIFCTSSMILRLYKQRNLQNEPVVLVAPPREFELPIRVGNTDNIV